ncbi:MAG: hypothetical protein K6C08_00415 [Oscillospiraceae bacterium]|nr:hypothetical protein [Oscillospiraceae bacterium]
MINRKTADNALRIAMRYARLNKESVICTHLSCDNDIYEITLRTPYQIYEFYVDPAACEVIGINAEPSLELNCLCDSAYEIPFAA